MLSGVLCVVGLFVLVVIVGFGGFALGVHATYASVALKELRKLAAGIRDSMED